MFDHIGITVRDLKKSVAFYTAALAPLGIKPSVKFPGWQSFGTPGKGALWLAEGTSSAAHPRVHIAFVAERGAVESFYLAALQNGGTDNGKPGPRPHYHQHYYGAFVIDPDGHNIEAVCHAAPRAAAKPPKKKTVKAPATRQSNKKKQKKKR